MEMHQVRYFLAVARTLNFTRAADECNVTQPSLTRAVQKLEDELGGLLFRRERARTHLTDLGRQMLPFLDQTYEAAQAAKALAKGIGKAQVAPLHLGIASSVETDGLHAVLSEVASGLSGFALSMTDGSSEKLLELAFKGDLDLIMIEAPAGEHDRLNTWPLFVQRYRFFARGDHRLADRLDASIVDLAEESWIDCGTESVARLRAAAEAAGIEISFRHKVSGPGQIERLLLAGLGCTLLPKPMSLDDRLCSVALIDDGLIAPVILAGIAGRQRSPAADAFIRAARARSWPDR
ncbi:DNA-binding transcriptional LysR family regulator [Blastomonas natatoria]|jgi:DNA-binding transcriptional LysR family regulator|uniref:DNA-binding transcriptional LysR family regulator n=2 Tax=Blastomonas natatoria TaxID=34015 RepID=A0A2V3USS4_9SPHN|nr:DNA-binding transcriptional LysR family regulator [Blastomonas natatoria]